MSRPRVLVTGAAGFIGSACLRTFARNGWQAGALLHRTELGQGLASHPQIEVFYGSVTDAKSLRSIFQEFSSRGSIDVVVHCAARVTDLGPASSTQRVNLHGTENVVASVREFGAGKIVHLSTTDVYGLRDFDCADESTPLDRTARNPYPKFKVLSEDVIRNELDDADWNILRPGVVWGEGDCSIQPRILRFLRASPAIFHFGKHRGRNIWPLAYVENVALVALAAALNGESGKAYNVLDPEETSMEQYLRLMLRTFFPERKRIASVSLPYWAGWVVAAPSTLLSNLLKCEDPLWDPTLYGLQSASSNLSFSSKKAGKLLRSVQLDWIPRKRAVRQFQESITRTGDPVDSAVTGRE